MTDTVKKAGPVRRLYDWVLHWAETPYGVAALFVLALAESSFLPIPPAPLLIALCLGAASKSLRFALIATSASVLGGIIGYGIGAGAWGLAEP
ncbi:MAG: DedA family protein, partial [Gemmatimonadetes bacterium]|nr:DedA family protein [Gemmatimonadota bacterium]